MQMRWHCDWSWQVSYEQEQGLVRDQTLIGIAHVDHIDRSLYSPPIRPPVLGTRLDYISFAFNFKTKFSGRTAKNATNAGQLDRQPRRNLQNSIYSRYTRLGATTTSNHFHSPHFDWVSKYQFNFYSTELITLKTVNYRKNSGEKNNYKTKINDVPAVACVWRPPIHIAFDTVIIWANISVPVAIEITCLSYRHVYSMDGSSQIVRSAYFRIGCLRKSGSWHCFGCPIWIRCCTSTWDRCTMRKWSENNWSSFRISLCRVDLPTGTEATRTQCSV